MQYHGTELSWASFVSLCPVFLILVILTCASQAPFLARAVLLLLLLSLRLLKMLLVQPHSHPPEFLS